MTTCSICYYTAGLELRPRGTHSHTGCASLPRHAFLALIFAHLARCAAAIFLRADADIVRLTGVGLGADFTFAHRALCARAMRRRAAAETMRLPPVVVRPVVGVLPAVIATDSRAAIA